MFAAGKTAAVSGETPDAQFNYVTMLLHGDGTNGAQNNTFLDSSTNNFTITRNGNTTQGSFSPYGSNWSNYFDGSGDYLTVPDNTALDMGSSDFTLECWLYSTVGTSNECVVNKGYSNSLSYLIFLDANTAGFFASSNGSTWDICSNSSIGSVPKNTWTHIAVCRSGSSIRLFNNGALVTTVTSSASFFNSADNLIIGSTVAGSFYYNGYLSNVRLVKGTALYTSAFTPSTTPLTAITNTSLLTCQSNRFIDNSANNFAITVNGNTSVQRFNPFGASTAYSTSVIGGSGYFDGSGDTLTTSTSQIIPTGSFTVECWAYVTGTGANQKFVAQGSSGAAGRFSLGIEGGNWWVQLGGDAIQTGTPVKNQWNYVAVTYNGSTITLYVNGTLIGTVSSTANAQNTTLTIGQDWNSYIVTGYVADVRISNTVRTITVPTAPYSSDGSTRLLLSMTNGAIYDNAMMNDLETVGNAQISTSVKKYGTGSLAFDGTGDYLKVPASPNLIFGTGDFTIECWIYVSSNPAQYTAIVSNWAGADPAWILDFSNGSGNIRFNDNGNVYLTSSSTLTTGQWNHVAVSRSGTSLKMFFNGTSVATATNSTSFGSASAGVFVGAYYDGTYALNGYIDDLRITKGYARYTANFTPPTAAFPNIGPV